MQNRHPWLYNRGVAKMEAAAEGDVIEIRSHEDAPLAWGHYIPDRSLLCRLFAFAPEAAPPFGEDFWRARLREARELRRRLLDQTRTDAFRLVNAEGDRLPGMVIDRYADTAVLQLRTEGARRLRPLLLDFLTNEADVRFVFDKTEHKDAEEKTGEWLTAPKPEVLFKENGLAFAAAPETGQKTGFYLDQRENRALLETLSAGRRVLNAFSYTGGFSVYALRGGAESVVSLDSAANAGELCLQNVAANISDAEARHRFEAADCFKFLREQEKDAFDLIVLDPPAFTKHISTVKKASRGYKDINMKAMNIIEKGGLLFTFSCSQHVSADLFRKIVFAAAADAGRPVRLLRQLGHPTDHPVDIFHPEGEYLKGLVLQVG